MSAMQWNEAQLAAIRDEGGALLVSAAAGSGKTAVLVERAVRLITRPENPVDADRLLILTFTRAAAEELRSRIGARLEAELQARPGEERLRRQRLLLRRAFVGTIDAFCLQLVREHFAALDLAPDVNLADDGLLAQLREEALADTMEAALAQPDFAAFAALYGQARSDRMAEQAVLALHSFTRSLPYPEQHLRRYAKMYEEALPPEQSPWGGVLLEKARQAGRAAVEVARGLMAAAQAAPSIAAYLPALQADCEGLAALCAALAQGWDTGAQAAAGFVPTRLAAVRGGDEQAKEAVKQGRKVVQGLVEDIRSRYLCCTAAQWAEDLAAARPLVEALVEATLDFDRRFYAAKLEERVLDYADFEHLALRLLQGPDGTRTALAERVSGRYEAVMVDEYQDTNDLQSALYTCLARADGGNLFYVGDVKQSIYRFRNANPGLFLQKRESWAPYESGRHPAVLRLGHNYRSAPAVIDGVNSLFEQLMSPELGEVAYNEEERLLSGRAGLDATNGVTAEEQQHDENADAAAPGAGAMADEAGEERLVAENGKAGAGVRLCLVDGTDEDAEVEWVAERIRQMVAAGAPVVENGGQRPCGYGDFCVILRVKRRIPAFLAALEARGIPALADLDADLLQAPEVLPLTAALAAVDNPGDDISLSAAMLGPLFRFSPDELTRLRAQSPRGRLWAALAADSSEKTRALLRDFGFYRALAAELPVGRLCEELVGRTGYLSAVAAMEDGAARRENVQRFIGWAGQVGATGRGGLAGFVRMLQNGAGPQPPAIKTVPGHVSLLTIHKSKGLEFPFCFLADAARRFNTRSQTQRVQMHPELGIGLALRSGDTLYPTGPLLAIRARTAAEELSEEMRALYVALTRAKQQMVVIFAEKDPAALVARHAARLAPGRPNPYMLARAGSFAGWLMEAALRLPGGAPLLRLALPDARDVAGTEADVTDMAAAEGLAAAGATGGFAALVVQPPAGAAGTRPVFRLTAEPDAVLVAALAAGFGQTPARAALEVVPAKRSVSAIVKQEEAPLRRRPSFMYASGLTAAERGTAQHSFMQFADYAAAAANLEGEIERLWQEGYLEKDLARAVDREGVRRFLASPLAARMNAACQVLREYDFITAVPAGLLQPDLPASLAEEQVLVQGIADLVLITGAGAEIVDYKTDHGVDAATLARRYGGQLRLYRQALEKRLALPVHRLTIWAFALAQEVQVPLEGDNDD